MLSARARRDHVTHLDFLLRHDDPIYQQLDETPLLFEARSRQSFADPPTVVLHPIHHPSQFAAPPDLLPQFPLLTGERLRPGFDLPLPSLILHEVEHAPEVSLGQPLDLLLQPRTRLPQTLSPRRQLLGQPTPAPRPIQLQRDQLRLPDDLTQVRPYQLVQLPGRREA